MSGQILDLGSLRVDDIRGLLDLLIDDLLVVDIDQRYKVEDRGGDERETPQRNELDEPVADDGRSESLREDN